MKLIEWCFKRFIVFCNNPISQFESSLIKQSMSIFKDILIQRINVFVLPFCSIIQCDWFHLQKPAYEHPYIILIVFIVIHDMARWQMCL